MSAAHSRYHVEAPGIDVSFPSKLAAVKAARGYAQSRKDNIAIRDTMARRCCPWSWVVTPTGDVSVSAWRPR